MLYTKDISFDGLLRLKGIEEMVETFYNSGKAKNTIRYMVEKNGRAFSFFETLALWWEKNGYDEISHSKMDLYGRLFDFFTEQAGFREHLGHIRELLRFDIFLGDNMKNIPQSIERDQSEKERKWEREFYENPENIEKYLPELGGYTPRQLLRMCRIEFFDIDPITGEDKKTAVLFDYYGRDELLNKAKSAVVWRSDGYGA